MSCSPSRLEGGHGAASALSVRPACSLSPWSSFRVPLRFERGEGLVPSLRSRTVGRRLSDSAAAEPDEREKRKPGSMAPRAMGPGTGSGTSRKKAGQSIRRPARIRPLHQARSGVEPWQADGRQPFMPQECLTTPAFEDLSLPFRSCEADAAAFRRARDNAFHPAMVRTYREQKAPVKKIHKLRSYRGHCTSFIG
jgi:hypothetical protein